MGKLGNWLLGAGLGAGYIYFNDPNMGRRRRAELRNQIDRFMNKSDESIEKAIRDLRNRTRGVIYETAGRLEGAEAPDWIIAERIRSRLGYLTRHPGAIQVDVQNGNAILTGSVLESEVEELVNKLSNVRGVNEVVNQLTQFAQEADIPDLQGNWGRDEIAARDGRYWTPSSRLLAGLGAGALFLYGKNRRGLIGTTLSLASVGLAFRALTNMDFARILGISESPRVVDVMKTINIQAPIEEVYSLWSRFEEFPRFMEHIQEIHDLGDGRSHWVVKGPAGIPVEFNARITENIPEEVIAWETEHDSPIKHRGRVRFRDYGEGITQASVRMTYSPPAGLVGHTVASIMGVDPKQAMDEDLVRFKSLLETGKTSAGGNEINKNESDL